MYELGRLLESSKKDIVQLVVHTSLLSVFFVTFALLFFVSLQSLSPCSLFLFCSLSSKHPMERCRISTKTEPGRQLWSKWPIEQSYSTQRSLMRSEKRES